MGTKTVVESICHPSGVFSVCHACEWHIDKFPPFLLLCMLFSKWPTSLGFVESSEYNIYHFFDQQEKVVLLVSARCLFVFIVTAYTFNLKTTFFTVKTFNEIYCCRIYIYFCQLHSKSQPCNILYIILFRVVGLVRHGS